MLDPSPSLDRVSITNAASGDGSQLLQLFGRFSPSPYPVYSVGNFIQVIFTSVTGQYSGFNATYTAITSGERLSLMDTPIIKSQILLLLLLAELSRGAPWVRKFSKLTIRENLVMT